MQADTEDESFWRLDNSAVFTAATSSREGPFIYRLSCELSETLDVSALQEALSRVVLRFPYFFVQIRSGFFWHYFEPIKTPVTVEKESGIPCSKRPNDRRKPLCRIYAYGKTLSCEFHHAITDGTGGLIFLRVLVIEYLSSKALLQIDKHSQSIDFLFFQKDPHPSEWEDSYRKYFEPKSPFPDAISKAWLVPGPRMRTGYRVLCGQMPVALVLEKARALKISLTEFVTAVYLLALQDIYLEERDGSGPKRSRRLPISIQIPVNLRALYPSTTMRNFFLFAAPSIDPRLGSWSLEEIAERVHHQMKLGTTKKEFLRHLRRNVGGEAHWVGRVTPLLIKDFALKIINKKMNVALYSGSISNLGIVKMPESAIPFVKRFLFVPPSNKDTGISVGLLSWNDQLFVTTGSTLINRKVEQRFFSRFVELGIPVFVEGS